MKLGAYSLIRKIAEGGIAEIYLAKGRTKFGGDKYLVCKCIKSSIASDAEFLGSIIREAQLSVKMRHPNILEVFDLCSSDGRSYLTMEYMDAPDFQHILMKCREKGQRLPLGAALYVVLEAAKGLHYAHELCDNKARPLNLVHRDISPENIMLTWKGDVKIGDFGIAKTNQMPDITPPDTVKGKFGYMSPEQAWGDKVDRRTDVFSLAVVLYEATLGRSFYGQDCVADMLMAARVCQFLKPTDVDPDYPPALEAILLKALELDKNERYQTASDFGNALEACIQCQGWCADKEMWVSWMHRLLEEPPSLPSMCAAEIGTDPNSIIRHQEGDVAEIKQDYDRTIPLSSEAVIAELRRLSMQSAPRLTPSSSLNAGAQDSGGNIENTQPLRALDGNAIERTQPIRAFGKAADNTQPIHAPGDSIATRIEFKAVEDDMNSGVTKIQTAAADDEEEAQVMLADRELDADALATMNSIDSSLDGQTKPDMPSMQVEPKKHRGLVPLIVLGVICVLVIVWCVVRVL